jgi:hypothetical protein
MVCMTVSTFLPHDAFLRNMLLQKHNQSNVEFLPINDDDVLLSANVFRLFKSVLRAAMPFRDPSILFGQLLLMHFIDRVAVSASRSLQ